jgi:hypothetical protein
VLFSCGGDRSFAPDAGDAATTGADVTFGDSAPWLDAGACSHSVETGYSPGPDGVIGTSDDVVVVVSQIDFETVAGKYRRHIELDQQSSQKTYAIIDWDPQTAAFAQNEVWTAPGADGVFGTADDVVNNWSHQATPTAFFDYNGPGPDGVWKTADDAIGPVDFEKNEGGRVVESYSSGPALVGAAAGPDGVWGTSDDHFVGATKYFYDSTGNATEEISLTAGADGAFDTPDDVIVARIVFPCQSKDRVVMESYDKGPDGVFRTDDDVVVYRIVESGDFCETLSCSYAQPH